METLKENLGFVLVCLVIFAALCLLALGFEKWLCQGRKKFSDTHYAAYVAIFAAMAGVLMLIEIPLPFAPPFYKLDLTELIKVLLKLLLRGTSTAFVGDFANFAVGCSFVLPASVVYHARPCKKTALIGLVAGTLVMTVFGSAFNAIYLLPKFSELYGMPLEAIVGMGTKVNPRITSVSTLVLFAVVPFNLLKGTIDALLTLLLYKRISPLLHKGDAYRKKSTDEAAA